MVITHFSHNGTSLPIDQAVVPLNNIAYSYGYGVYETIRVLRGVPYFIEEHCQRLMDSAAIISLEHTFSEDRVMQYCQALLTQNNLQTVNLKILLIGGQTAADANLYILPLNPLFPDKKLYTRGVHCLTANYERAFPHAKTLNMLPSYLAYKKAQSAGAYDALLLRPDGTITEGTRTNFFTLHGTTIFTPPEEQILLGVMRKAVLMVAKQHGYEIKEQPIACDELDHYEAAFLTSTSSKLLPIHSVNDHQFDDFPASLPQLMQDFEAFYTSCQGRMEP